MNTLRSRVGAATLSFALVAAAMAPLLAAAAAPVSISSGPTEGSTNASGSVTFEFSSGDASSTPVFECSIVGQSDINSFFNCGSPQTYALPDGSYRFAVRANGDDSTISQRSFMLGTASSSATSTETATSTDTGSGSGSTSTSTPSGAPTVTITSGPAEGATSTSGSVAFEFTVDDASSTVMCSIVGQSDIDSFFVCTSPQTYTLPDGMYRFSVQATNAASSTGSATRSFGVASSTPAPAPEPTPEPAPAPAPSGGGGGGNGNGSIAGGPPEGHTVIPGGSGSVLGVSTGGNAVIPTAPDNNSSTQFSSSGTQSRAASVAVNTGSTVATKSTSSTVARSSGTSAAVTPAIPNTGTEVSTEDTVTPTQDLGVAPTTSDLGAAATTSGTSIPGWVWLVLAGIVLVGIGIWALRQPA